MRDLAADRYWEPEVELAPRATIEGEQEAMLLDLVRYAWDRAPLYRKVWGEAGVRPEEIRSLDDYRERIPFISKDTIRRFRDTTGDPYGGLLCVDPAELTGVSSTSGTTGDPTLIPERWEAGGGPGLSRDLWEMGVRPGDHVVIPMFTFRGPTYNLPHALGAVPVIFDHDPAVLGDLYELCRELRPTAWYSLSGPLVLGLRRLEQEGADLRDMFSSFEGVVFSGEPLGRRAAADLERWGVPLFHHSAAGDVGAAFECREHDGLHVWEDVGLYECLDPDGDQPVPDGEVGELVASSLRNRVMPLLRFRSDDLDRLTRRPCGCGRTHARLWTLGRKGDEVVVAGRSVLPLDVWAAVEALDECEAGLFQIVRPAREVDVLRLRVGHEGPPTEALHTKVIDSVTEALGVPTEVELVPNAQLLALGPPHKIPRVTRA